MSGLYKLICTVFFSLYLTFSFGQNKTQRFSMEFYGGTFNFELNSDFTISVPGVASAEAVRSFYALANRSGYQTLLDSLNAYKQAHQLNDWLFYQLIRKTAQQLSPKEENYFRYTLYKWFFLVKSGYDARLAIARDKVIFYIFNDEDISDIPFFMIDNKKYMCLNYHDYGRINFEIEVPKPVNISIPEAKKAFSYKVTRMPAFKPENYSEKELQFSYRHKVYHFKIKFNAEVQSIFANYPVVDFESYFNIPLSRETYGSLIPILKTNTRNMSQKKGIDYLMRFTRYAFLFGDDEKTFGKEKRLSPEQTLFSDFSDCDDRAALFFYLVKEIYNLPMVALLYPTHITIAVGFDKPVGQYIEYQGRRYSVCEPTPQVENLRIGQVTAGLKKEPYKVVYQYNPHTNN